MVRCSIVLADVPVSGIFLGNDLDGFDFLFLLGF